MEYLTKSNTPSLKFSKREAISNEQYYQYGWVRVGHLIYPLSRACRIGDMLLAKRILNDLEWEWESQDVLAQISGNENISEHHLGADCLVRLSLLVSGKLTRHGLSWHRQRIVSEIKRIEERLDAMFFCMENAERSGNRPRPFSHQQGS